MTKDNTTEFMQSNAASTKERLKPFGQHVTELIDTDKAHLPKFPALPSLRQTQKSEAIQEFETRIQQIFDQHVLSPVAQEEIKETIQAKLDSTAVDVQELTKDYSKNVIDWLEYKRKMLEQADDTSLIRWDTASGIYMLSPPNKGKAITDTNPYVNIVDLEEFDTSVEVNPPHEDLPMHEKETLIRWVAASHRDVLGKPDVFLAQINADKQRMTEEARGLRIPPVADEKETDLQKLKEEIRAFAKDLGFPAMGITRVDRRYVAAGLDEEIKYDTVVLLAHEMPYEDVMSIPERYPFAAMTSYRDGGRAAHQVADFIRSKGYKCLTRVSIDSGFKFSPHAVNSGMGSYSTYGIAIIPEVGTRTKIVGVLTEAELPLDEPREYNIEEFCARCRSCQKVCPSGAIPKHERRFHGVLKRQTYHQRCWEYMATKYQCMMCVRICPFSVIGYDKCMQAMPKWYWYNLHIEEIDTNFLRSPWQKEA